MGNTQLRLFSEHTKKVTQTRMPKKVTDTGREMCQSKMYKKSKYKRANTKDINSQERANSDASLTAQMQRGHDMYPKSNDRTNEEPSQVPAITATKAPSSRKCTQYRYSPQDIF
jgi:hypothetical protein